ncbi:MAG TPA: hypothetical protein V6C81_29770 [Planktothrix sp.]
MSKNWLQYGLLVVVGVSMAVAPFAPVQALNPARVCPPIASYLPTDEPQTSSTFVERLSSGFYIDWTGWLRVTASELEPVINDIADCDIIRTAVIKPVPETILKADLTLRRDGHVVSMEIDGQHCYERRKRQIMEGLQLPAFPIGSELNSITVRFDMGQHQITVVPQLTQVAGAETTVH